MEFNQQKLANIINNFYYYCQCISDYEKYFDYIYKSKHEIEQRGYLIDLEEFKKFIEHINYNIYKNKSKEEYEDNIQIKIIELLSMNKSIYFTKLEPFKMKSSEEFINILKSKKKYKLINKELHKIICKSESKDNYISYYINQSELFFILDDVLSFQYNNILTIDSYTNKNNNKVNQNFQNNNINDNINTNDNNENKRENISINNKFINSFNDFNNNFINNKNDNYLLNITNAMIELYLIKIKMENEIKKDIEYNGIGYLIDKESIEKWRRKINYDDIKTKFFEIYFKDNNINISNEKRYEVLNFIKNSGLKIEKFEFQCLNFKSQKDIECYTQKKIIGSS